VPTSANPSRRYSASARRLSGSARTRAGLPASCASTSSCSIR
jgi:hypothetical protein